MAVNIGPAAMPSAHDNKAPYFSGEVGDPLDDFLREYEEHATTCNLTPQQKVEMILHYVPQGLRDLWKLLTGYSTHDWAIFQQSLERLYQSTSAQSKYSKQKLYDFVYFKNRTRIRDVEDVHQYYRQFHIFSEPLLDTHQITTDERDSAFWYGFHPDDRDRMYPRLIAKLPDHLMDQPFGMDDVFKAACLVFASSLFIPIELQERRNRFQAPKPEQPSGEWYDQSDRDPRVSDHEGRFREREPHFTPRESYVRPERDRGFSHDHFHRPRAPSPPHPSDHHYRPRAPSPPRAQQDPPPTHDRQNHSPPRARRDWSPPPRPSIETRTLRFKDPI